MDRRGFLRALAAGTLGAAAHTLDLDRLLWVPGERTIFLPALAAPDVKLFHRGNIFVTPEWINHHWAMAADSVYPLYVNS